ncbi:MAG TPA: ABC transporter permease [Caulobacteraceae bacterium]|jgi:peptide/nickel transport system permease protein|nr:ABC transporter permease [Caulobacteraceae bacterium]
MLKGLRDLAFVLIATTTVLFFLIRLTGDPAVVIAGEGATPAQIAEVSAAYGFDKSLVQQYLIYLWKLLHLDFGTSLADGQPALGKALAAYPATLALAAMAIALNVAVSLPLGAWLGQSRGTGAKGVRVVLTVMQGFPGFVFALLLVNVFAVGLEWLPSVGYGGPETWILPTVSVVSFLAPKLTRVVEANTQAALGSNFVRTARSIGASEGEILRRHVLPNALLGAVALIGSEIAFMLTGLVIIETIFAWPGIGWLLVRSTLNLDFPVVQAVAFLMVIGVFLTNAATEAVQALLDPRLRTAARPR